MKYLTCWLKHESNFPHEVVFKSYWQEDIYFRTKQEITRSTGNMHLASVTVPYVLNTIIIIIIIHQEGCI